MEREKARINPSNHDGITFRQAVEALFDLFLVVVDESRNDEDRDAVIGLDRRWNLLYVVYIEHIGQGLRDDLEPLEGDTVSTLIASLKRHGVSDEIIREALNETTGRDSNS